MNKLTIGCFFRKKGKKGDWKMVKKQRLALAISSALSLIGGAGCSTTSAVKTATTGDGVSKVIVHHISYQRSAPQFKRANMPMPQVAAAIRERQLDDEINALALKLGLSSQTVVNLSSKENITQRPQIRPAVYKKNKTIIRKVVARQERPFNHAIASKDISAFEREVNRLYATRDDRSTPSQLKRNSLWARVKNGYRLEDETQNFIVQRVLQEYERNPAHLNGVFTRSSKYLYFILDELNRRNMPTELALLPMVESGYINKDTPRAGSAGIWQFNVATGKRFGLRQSVGFDERLDIFASTRAALTYLQKLNKEFKGDWHLTLAAYSAGSAKIHQERANNLAKGLATDYWSLNLPLATREYIPRILAYKEVLNRPQAYGVNLPTAPNKITLVQASVNKLVDLRQVARTAGLPASILTVLNPALKDGITKPQLSREIVIPRQFASNIHKSIRRTSALRSPIVRVATNVPRINKSKIYRVSHKNKAAEKSKKAIVNYHVRSGDSLYKIALKHGTTVAKLMRLNDMENSKLRAGAQLLVAVKGSAKHYG